MAQKKNPVKKVFGLIGILAGLAVIGVLAVVGGFAFAASQEAHDSFCASCHTQPETTYYQRSTAGHAVDLASFHQPKQGRCIDCHSGQGLTGRMSAEIMGARNAVKWYTGTAIQPAVLTFAIGDGNCLKCHADVTQRGYSPKEQITVPGRGGEGDEGEEEGRGGHWHQFLARWQSRSADAGTCVSCHSGHKTDGTAQAGFMNSVTVEGECQACHQVLRREGD